MPETIVLIVDDLMFLPRLQNSLKQLGYQPVAATNDSRLTQALFKSPVLVIVDLFSQSFDWEQLIGVVKKSKAGPVPVLGFGPHVDLELRQKALDAGCNAVVGRGAVVSQLPHLVEKHKWVMDRSPCDAPPPALLLNGIELFNRREYFECHEVIEQAWNEESSSVRIMYQGILQIGVACYHIQNKNWPGAMKVLDRGVSKLQRFTPSCMGINLEKLLTDSEAIRQELLRLGQEWQGDFDDTCFPTIQIDTA